MNSILATAVMMMVDPDTAAKFLALSLGNRRLRRSVIEKYKADMLAGKWTLSSDCIAFDENGNLINGHHRLVAIIESGVTVPLLVAKNVPSTAKINIDCGLTRSVSDYAHFSGQPSIDKTAVSIARIIESPLRPIGRAYSNAEVLVILDKHRQAILFACEHLPKKKGICAYVRCAIARAFYHVDHQRLLEFCTALHTGRLNHAQHDLAASRLMMYLVQNPTSAANRSERFLKTCTAIHHFVARNPIDKLYGVPGNEYGLPE